MGVPSNLCRSIQLAKDGMVWLSIWSWAALSSIYSLTSPPHTIYCIFWMLVWSFLPGFIHYLLKLPMNGCRGCCTHEFYESGLRLPLPPWCGGIARHEGNLDRIEWYLELLGLHVCLLYSRSLFRDPAGFSAVVEFVVVGSVTGIPSHMVFRHAWRDSNRAWFEILHLLAAAFPIVEMLKPMVHIWQIDDMERHIRHCSKTRVPRYIQNILRVKGRAVWWGR